MNRNEEIDDDLDNIELDDPDDKPNYYIPRKEFEAAIADYYEAATEKERMDKVVEGLSEDDKSEAAENTRKLWRKAKRKEQKTMDICGVAIYNIVKGLSKNGKFCGYTWKEEMISDALTKCNRALIGKKFNLGKGYNPFSYFNSIAFNEFRHRIKLEKKYIDTQNKYKSENYGKMGLEGDALTYVKPLYNDRVANINLWADNDESPTESDYQGYSTEQE